MKLITVSGRKTPNSNHSQITRGRDLDHQTSVLDPLMFAFQFTAILLLYSFYFVLSSLSVYSQDVTIGFAVLNPTVFTD